MPATNIDLDAAIAAARDRLPAATRALADLARIPGISADPARDADVRASAERTAQILADHGLEHVEVLELDGAHPSVYGDWLHAGAGAPTVLLYAHHDVQPPGVVANWTSDPFDPVERDGRLYARGICDDKAGVLAHVTAVGAWLQSHERIPVNVKVFVEGEEEIGSPNLGPFLERYRDQLRADVFVLADAGQWDVGIPAITCMLRGLVAVDVTLRALASPVHSGMHGGVVPDPVMAMAKLLASMTDDAGDVAIATFADDVRPLTAAERSRIERLPGDVAQALREAGALDGVQPAGDPALDHLERLWARPAITIIGFDSHPIEGSSNQIVAKCSARVSLRLAPGQDPQRCTDAIEAHVAQHTPWGLQATVDRLGGAPAWTTDPEGPAFVACERALREAFGAEPVLMGMGGSVPFVGPFIDTFGGIPALLIGPEDPYSRAHGEDESLHLDDWRKLIETEVRLLAHLAGD